MNAGKSLAVVWEIGHLFITYESIEGRYVLCGEEGPIGTFQGRDALRQAWECAQGMIGGGL